MVWTLLYVAERWLAVDVHGGSLQVPIPTATNPTNATIRYTTPAVVGITMSLVRLRAIWITNHPPSVL